MRADWIKLMIAAARLPLRSDPANNQFERPSAHGPAAAQMSEFTPYLSITPKRSSGLPNEKSGTKVAPSNDWPLTLGER